MKRILLVLIALSAIIGSSWGQCYELYFENEYGSPHYAYMTIHRNGSAQLTVKYPNGKGGWGCVYQVGRTANYGSVSGAEFSNPVFCGSSIRNPYYYADNIYWWYDSYGRIYLYNLDERAIINKAWIKLVPCT